MQTLKGHFDGTAIVLDEPADLAVGQRVQVVVQPLPTDDAKAAKRKSILGFAKGQVEFTMRETLTSRWTSSRTTDEPCLDRHECADLARFFRLRRATGRALVIRPGIT